MLQCEILAAFPVSRWAMCSPSSSLLALAIHALLTNVPSVAARSIGTARSKAGPVVSMCTDDEAHQSRIHVDTTSNVVRVGDAGCEGTAMLEPSQESDRPHGQAARRRDRGPSLSELNAHTTTSAQLDFLILFPPLSSSLSFLPDVHIGPLSSFPYTIHRHHV